MYRVVANVEAISPPPQEASTRPGKERLFEVQTLQEVQEPEDGQKTECELPGSAAATCEIDGYDKKADASRNGQRVEDRDDLQRFKRQQQPAAPGNIGVRAESRLTTPTVKATAAANEGRPSALRAARSGAAPRWTPNRQSEVSRRDGKMSRQSLITSHAPTRASPMLPGEILPHPSPIASGTAARTARPTWYS